MSLSNGEILAVHQDLLNEKVFNNIVY